MKKILVYLLTIIMLFSIGNVVEAKTIYKTFLVNCTESETAWKKYFPNTKLTKSGTYAIEVSDDEYKELSGNMADSSFTEGCGPTASDRLACSFGCLEEALTNGKDISGKVVGSINEITSALGDYASNVGGDGSYCKRVCFDKKKFYAPDSTNPTTVKQGGKFTWTNQFNSILTFKDERICYTIFDKANWIEQYNTSIVNINNYSESLKSSNIGINATLECPNGYSYMEYSGRCRRKNGTKSVTCDNGEPTLDGRKWVCPGGGTPKENDNYDYASPKASCKDTNYELRNDGKCYMTEARKTQLINLRIAAADNIENLRNAAENCVNSESVSAIPMCNDVTISYDDEVYGKMLDQNAEYRKLVGSGSSTGPILISSKIGNITFSIFDCPKGIGSCTVKEQPKVDYLDNYKASKIITTYNWDLKSDLFSCIDINGKSYLSCAMAADAAPNRYITVGSNFPVSFNASTGVKNISINYGCSDATNATNGDACHYNVEKCPDNICAPVDPDDSDDPSCVGEHCDTSNPPGGSIYAIYRTIDLNNPFPNRTPGDNWNKNDNAKTYIENNRGAKTEDVYSLEPLYKIELDPAKIKEIRKDNKNVDYGSFDDLTCTNGENCKSSYLNELVGKGYLTVNGG